MSIRSIRKNGEIVAYQAVVGVGGKGQTRSYAVSAYANLEVARRAAERGAAKLGRETGAKKRGGIRPVPSAWNTSGIVGIRARYEGSPENPTLRIAASWRRAGKNVAVGYSVEKNGLKGALAKAMAAREKGTGAKLGLSLDEALALIQPLLDRLAAKD
jgi:hypothetical protein